MTVQKLGELGVFARGVSRHRPRNDSKLFEGGGFPLIQTGEISRAILYVTEHTKEYNDFGIAQSKVWPKGTLAITIAANIAESALLGYPMAFPDSVVAFKADAEKTSELYVHYLLEALKQSIQNSIRDTGSIQDNINLEFLRDFEFDVPSLDEQRRTVELLEAVDRGIELQDRTEESLIRLAKLLFSQKFMSRFEKSNAQKKEGSQYLRLDSNAEIMRGTTITEKTAVTDGKIKVIASGANFSYKHNKANRTSFTITVSSSGKAGVVNLWMEDIWASDTNTIQGNSVAETVLIYLFLITIQGSIYNFAAGSVQQHVYPEDLKGLPFIELSDEDVAYVQDNLIPIFNLIQKANKKKELLSEYRSFILPQVVSGTVGI